MQIRLDFLSSSHLQFLKMAFIHSDEDWQSTKETILQRNHHMLNNPDINDINFTCEGLRKIFYAHKYVLGTSSAVFPAMFYGGLAVKNSLIYLADKKRKKFRAVSEVFLHGGMYIDLESSVVGILYLAKKYIVRSLSVNCVDFLGKNLNPKNVLSVLEQAIRSDEREFETQQIRDKVIVFDSFNTLVK